MDKIELPPCSVSVCVFLCAVVLVLAHLAGILAVVVWLLLPIRVPCVHLRRVA